MEMGHGNTVKLTIHGSMAKAEGPIVVLASKEELGTLYLPGVGVQITIHPLK